MQLKTYSPVLLVLAGCFVLHIEEESLQKNTTSSLAGSSLDGSSEKNDPSILDMESTVPTTTTSITSSTGDESPSTSTSGSESSTTSDETTSSAPTLPDLPPHPVCPNGILEEGEECDIINSDACTDTCTKNGRLAFVSSYIYSGDMENEDDSFFPNGFDPNTLSGINDADMQCWYMAHDAMKTGALHWSIPSASSANRRFMAWLSRDLVWPTEPDYGFTQCITETPFFLPDGNRIAESLPALVSPNQGGGLERQINKDEFGNLVENVSAWTNTLSDGTLNWIFGDCHDWTDAEYSINGNAGKIGLESDAVESDQWTDYEGRDCNEQLRIYCFEQCPPP